MRNVLIASVIGLALAFGSTAPAFAAVPPRTPPHFIPYEGPSGPVQNPSFPKPGKPPVTLSPTNRVGTAVPQKKR